MKKQKTQEEIIKAQERAKKSRANRLIRIRSWYKELKKNKVCSKCGEREIKCLDFHHIEKKKKKMSISRMVSVGRSKRKIIEEMEKCICLCSNCHRKHHQEERNLKYIGKKKGRSELERFIIGLKSDKKCEICEEKEICCLEFHHVRGEKLFAVGESIKLRLGKDDILKEIEKCIILCSNCHRKEH